MPTDEKRATAERLDLAEMIEASVVWTRETTAPWRFKASCQAAKSLRHINQLSAAFTLTDILVDKLSRKNEKNKRKKNPLRRFSLRCYAVTRYAITPITNTHQKIIFSLLPAYISSTLGSLFFMVRSKYHSD